MRVRRARPRPVRRGPDADGGLRAGCGSALRVTHESEETEVPLPRGVEARIPVRSRIEGIGHEARQRTRRPPLPLPGERKTHLQHIFTRPRSTSYASPHTKQETPPGEAVKTVVGLGRRGGVEHGVDGGLCPCSPVSARSAAAWREIGSVTGSTTRRDKRGATVACLAGVTPLTCAMCRS